MNNYEYSVTINQIIKEFSLEQIYLPENGGEDIIYKNEVNRPGLPLAGFFEKFEHERPQIIGMAEHEYALRMTDEQRREAFEKFCQAKPVCVI